jgi:hypothetical protein
MHLALHYLLLYYFTLDISLASQCLHTSPQSTYPVFILIHLESRLVLRYISDPGSRFIHALNEVGTTFETCPTDRLRLSSEDEEGENSPNTVDPLQSPQAYSLRRV